MNSAKLVAIGFFVVAISACASAKYKTFSSADSFKTAGESVKGKTPKEVAQTLGQPMSAYYKDGDKSVYYMVYPMGEKQVGMMDLMMNDRLECLAFNFEQKNGYKYDGWHSNTGFTCGAIKGEKLDTSLLK